MSSFNELVFIEYKLITLKYNGFCLQYFTWIICVLLSNKVSVLPNVKTDFNISMYCYYVILVMSYSYHKKILRPFSSQENFLSSKYFFDLVHTHFIISIAKFLAKRNMCAILKNMCENNFVFLQLFLKKLYIEKHSTNFLNSAKLV